MQKIIPHIWYASEAEEAARLYAGLVPGSQLGRTTRYGKAGFEHHGQPEGAVMTVEFSLGGFEMVGLNAGPIFRPSPAVSYFVTLGTDAEVDRFWAAMSDGGETLMALDAYPWAAKYGWLNDRFGVSWQVAQGKRSDVGQTVAPALMFTGARAGQAEAAMEFYVSLFPGSSIDGVLRHDGSGDDPKGTVQHAQFRLGGETFMAMDSAGPHAFTFTEANSHLILCEDQAEIDHYWNAMSAEPQAEACGWLRDRFGVSWQVAPAKMMAMMTDPDPKRVARVTEAFMGMKKLDIAALEAARAA